MFQLSSVVKLNQNHEASIMKRNETKNMTRVFSLHPYLLYMHSLLKGVSTQLLSVIIKCLKRLSATVTPMTPFCEIKCVSVCVGQRYVIHKKQRREASDKSSM